MQKILLLICFFCYFTVCLSAQTQISGIVNEYAGVSEIDFCKNELVLDNVSNFSTGDRVLLIQTKGASINISNSSSFGSITNLNQAGKHEFNHINSINGNTVTLEYEFLHPYSQAASLQLVKVPQYQDVIISDTLTSLEWDGFKGGIVVIEATGYIQIDGQIDVSGKGFRGGAIFNSGFICTWSNPQSDYYYTLASGRAGRKGESIVNYNPNFECGRGAYGTGGGGGNDHNTGGGGGGNYGSGGAGGKRLVSSQFQCNGEHRGLGGNPALYTSSTSRLLMGSGGGAGHVDDSLGTGGANGGGLVILIADQVISNSGRIVANGDNAKHGSYDGTGGGGAGGSIFIFSNNFQNTLEIEAKGGNGGNVSDNFITTGCHGPGGGGGGGFIGLSAVSFPSNMNSNLSGGIAGTNIQPSVVCSQGNNDPQDGSNGGYRLEQFFYIADVIYEPPQFSLSADTLICPGDTVQLFADGGEQYFWEPFASLDCSNCQNPFASPFVTTQYEVTMLSGFCEHIDTVTVEVKSMPQIQITPADAYLCTDTTITLTATGAPNLDYTWTGGDLTSSVNANSISVNPQETQTYTVSWTDNQGECTASKDLTVNVAIGESFGTFPDDKNICLGQSIQLIAAGGTSYLWSPDNNLTCNNCPNPIATPQETTTYKVIISNDFGCVDSATFTITVDEPVTFTAPNILSICKNDDYQIELSGNGIFNWSPDNYLSCNDCSNPVISNPQSDITYTVTLTNGACSHQETIEVEALDYPPFVLLYDTIYISFNEPYEVEWDASDFEYSFAWSPDIGIDDTSSANPIITGVNSGIYSVTVTDNQTGCSIVESFYLDVTYPEEEYDLVPKAFAPTGFGINAKFGPFNPGPGHQFISFRVFNRWGQNLFSGNNFEDWWDGSYKGQIQPMETYVYELVFIRPDGRRVIISGDVILVR